MPFDVLSCIALLALLARLSKAGARVACDSDCFTKKPSVPFTQFYPIICPEIRKCKPIFRSVSTSRDCCDCCDCLLLGAGSLAWDRAQRQRLHRVVNQVSPTSILAILCHIGHAASLLPARASRGSCDCLLLGAGHVGQSAAWAAASREAMLGALPTY